MLRCLSFLLIFSFNLMAGIESIAQVTIFPDVERRTDESVQIMRIEIDDIFTVIDMLYLNSDEEAWICAEKNFYIQTSGSGDRKYLIMAKGITLCPERVKITPGDTDKEFQLIFPRIDPTVRKIDVIEKPVSGFNFFGVWLDQARERPKPDSLDWQSRTEFEGYFAGQTGQLKSLEGIWKLTIVQAHYHGESFIDYLEEEPEVKEVAILWKDDHYACYGMDGKALESGFYEIAEGGRYAFREYFREVKVEVTTFVHMEKPGELDFNFNNPDRWAKYLLNGKFFGGDRLIKRMSFERVYPEQ